MFGGFEIYNEVIDFALVSIGFKRMLILDVFDYGFLNYFIDEYVIFGGVCGRMFFMVKLVGNVELIKVKYFYFI